MEQFREEDLTEEEKALFAEPKPANDIDGGDIELSIKPQITLLQNFRERSKTEDLANLVKSVNADSQNDDEFIISNTTVNVDERAEQKATANKYAKPIDAEPVGEDVKLPGKIDLDTFWDDLKLMKEDVDKMEATSFLFADFVVKAAISAYISPPNGGKTTIFRAVCETLAKRGQTVIYINVDGNPDDLKRHFKHAETFNYTVVAPDIKHGKSVIDAMNKLRWLADSDEDLTGYVFIIDTLKKFVDLMSKNDTKKALQIFRKINVKGATICLLGHANKYPDKDGNLIYEGTADLRADIDNLIYLYPEKDKEKNIQIVTSKPDKTRANFKEFSFKIDFNEDREVSILDEVFEFVNDNDKELIKLINEAIENNIESQKDIVEYCRQRTVIGRDRITKFLIEKSKGEKAFWVAMPTGFRNNIRYAKPEKGGLSLADF